MIKATKVFQLLHLVFFFLHTSVKAETLSELMASIRRRGVRAENLLKDGDNAIQRYRNLEARLQKHVDVQDALQSEYCHFKRQAENTKSWISQLLDPIIAAGSDSVTETLKSKALVCENPEQTH